jgi:hypothetical protein
MRPAHPSFTGTTLALVAVGVLALLAGCSQAPQQAVTTPPASTVATPPAAGSAAPASSAVSTPIVPVSSSSTTPASGANPPAKPKRPTKPRAATITKTQAAASLKKTVNSTLTSGSDPRAKVSSVDVKVLAKGSDGTWWAGGELTNGLDGGVVFAKKSPGGSWAIIDLGTGIDGSEMYGKAPSSIAAQFAAQFTP